MSDDAQIYHPAGRGKHSYQLGDEIEMRLASEPASVVLQIDERIYALERQIRDLEYRNMELSDTQFVLAASLSMTILAITAGIVLVYLTRKKVGDHE